MSSGKQLSNPFSAGGGGIIFETHVQASFVALMLTRGVCPCLPGLQIEKIKLQGKYAGFETDDLVVFTKGSSTNHRSKLLAQIKHRVGFTNGDRVFSEVIQAAWNDFTNPEIFEEGSDVLALITGPLSATDIYDFRELLEWARSQEERDLFQNVQTAKFSSDAKRRKLDALVHHLTVANGANRPTDNQIWRFMKSFHLLGYDLDVNYSSTVALLESLIGLASKSDVQTVWQAIVSEVQVRNSRAGTLTLDDMPEPLLEFFKIELTLPPPDIPTDSIREMVIANLLGGWSEYADGDKDAVVALYGGDLATWQDKVRNLLLRDSNLFSQKDGVWRVRDRESFWYAVGQRVTDSDLDKLLGQAVSILGERDLTLDLSPDERFAASIHGKSRRYSSTIRKGVAETLALCGARGGELATCSDEKPQSIAHQVVRRILSGDDWETWAGLNDVLPLIAEAAPDTFLEAIEKALVAETGAFRKVFEQETSGFAGQTYMTGVLWGLEALAWSSAYLVQVCRILVDLAALDPGGNWVNRPSNSLTTILLPWLPQTNADSSKRYAAVLGVLKSQPESGWRLLVSLLPERHSSSSGTHKPKWRPFVPGDWKDGVTNGQRWADERVYAELALQSAKTESSKLGELIRLYFRLDPDVRNALRKHLTSEEVLALPESDRYSLWNSLSILTSNHRRFADSEYWKVPEDALEELDAVADELMPQAPEISHRRLFSETEVNLYDGIGDYKEQRGRLEKLRRDAVREIFEKGGIELVSEFADGSRSPWQVGFALGTQEEFKCDDDILPHKLVSDDESDCRLAGGFVWGRFQKGAWEWVDAIDIANWSTDVRGTFFSLLPFHPEVWTRVEDSLGPDESEYWTRVRARPYESGGHDVTPALEKLIHVGRPDEALDGMRWLLMEKKVGTDVVLSALDALTADHKLDPIEIGEAIRFLQSDANVDEARLRSIEWKFLPFLGDFQAARPTKLSQALADDPEFFCEVFRTVYKPENDSEDSGGADEQADLARNAYHLLQEWKTPPGSRADRSFDPAALTGWVAAVKKKCEESGHWEFASSQIGEVLFYCPREESGLWIDPVCEILDAPDHNRMRGGFSAQIFNSRGPYTGDGGESTRQLGEDNQRLASMAEDKGFTRLSAELRRLSESYFRDARREAGEERPA